MPETDAAQNQMNDGVIMMLAGDIFGLIVPLNTVGDKAQ